MKHETIEYFDGDQKLIGEFMYNEKNESPQPTIIVYPAFEGRSEFALEYAESLVKKKYAAFVADIYGDGKGAKTIDECFELITPFLSNRALVRQRAVLAFRTLAENMHVNQNKIGAIGFCFGGMCALEVARSGENLGAVVSAHGVLAKSSLRTEAIKSQVLILHGYKDPQVPPEMLQEFANEMDASGVNDWTFTFFGGAKHSFTDPKTGTFDPQKEQEMGREYNALAAQRSHHYAIEFFDEILK